MSKNSKSLKNLSVSAIIAALYVVLTLFSSMFGLDKGIIQLRLSECLCLLPLFSPASVSGLYAGCMLSGILTGAHPMDIIFGSLATLIAAYLTYLTPKSKKFLGCLPPVILNAAVVPFILKYAYGLNGALWYFAVTVGISEFICAGILGYVLIKVLPKSTLELIK